MKNYLSITNTAAVVGLTFAISACSSQEEMVAKKPAPAAPAPAPEAKAEAKAPVKATKIAGDIGLLDKEKNYLIVVTKEGKLVTVDYDSKFQPIMRSPKPSKVADIGLGSSATVTYTKQGDKNIATNVEFLPAKGE